VINDEWPLLADRQLSSDAWTQWRKVFDAILDLEPVNRRQEDLRAFMLKNMESIARFRERRQIGLVAMVALFDLWLYQTHNEI
jgi:hypothetical protein